MDLQIAQIASLQIKMLFQTRNVHFLHFDAEYLMYTLLTPIMYRRKMICMLNDELRRVFL